MFTATIQTEKTASHHLSTFQWLSRRYQFRDIKAAFAQHGGDVAIYKPKTVACEITDYTFKGNHGEEWPVTRIAQGEYEITPFRSTAKRLFEITSKEIASPIKPSGPLNENTSSTRKYDSVNFFGMGDIDYKDGIKPDGRIVQTFATPRLGQVEVLFYGDLAYLRKPGRWWGHSYYRVDMDTLKTFFEPVRQPKNNVVQFPSQKSAGPNNQPG